ncbi:hypothetical protein DFH06DRAFT_1130394 [Mycena polygramma]|nr:hypothetical protein DFH06DRAFT_1130394 [Mycena polygramma]
MPETLAAAGEFHASRVCATKPDPTHCLAHKLSGDGKTLAAARELDASRLFAELLTGGAGASYVNSWIHRHTAVPETLAAAGELHVARLFGEVLTGGGLTASCFLAKSLPAEVSQLDVCLWRLTGSPGTLAGASYVNSWIHRHTAVPETLAAAGELHVARLFGEVLTGGGLTASCMPLANHWLAWNLSGGLRQQGNWMHRGSLPNSLPAEVSQLDVCLWRITDSPGTLAGVSYVNSWIHRHTAVPETLAAAGGFHVARLFGEVLTGGGLTASSLAGASYVNSWIHRHTAVPETLAAAGELHVARLFGEVLTGGGLTASSLAAAGELHVARLFGEVLTGGGLTASCFLAKSLPAEVSQLDVCLWRLTGSPGTLAGASYVNSWIHRHTAVPETLAAAGEFHASRVCGTKPDPTYCLAHKLSGDGKTLAAARELDASRLFAELLTGGAGVSYVNSWIHRHTAVPETLAAAGELHVARLFGEVLTGGGLTASSLAAAGELHVARLFGEVLTGGGLTASSGVSYVNSWIHRHTAVPETLAAAGGFHVARLFGEVLTGGGLTASSLAGASGSGGIPCIQSLWEKPDPTHCLAHKLSGDGKTLAAARELDASRLFAEVLTGGGLTASSLAAAGELHVARLFGEVLTGGGLTASCFLAKSLPAEVSQLDVCLWRLTGSPGTLAGASYVNSWIHRHTAVPETLAAAGELHVARLFGEVLTGGGLTASCMPLANHWLAWNLSGGLRQQGNWMHRGSLPNSLPAEVSQLDVCLWRITDSPGTLAGVSYVNSWIHRHTAVPETLAAAGGFHVARLFGEVLTGGGLTASSLAGASYVNSWIHRHTAVPETLAAAGELHVARLFGEVLTGGGLTASSLAAAGELHVARLFGEVLTGGGLTASCFLAKSLPAEVSQLDVCLWRLTGSPGTLAGASYVNSWIHRHTAVPETLAAAGEFHASRVCGTKPDPTYCLAHKLSGDGKTLAAARELDASRLFAELLTGGAGVSYVNSWIHRHTAVPETLAAAGELHVARLFGEVLTGGGLTASSLAAAGELHVARLFGEVLTGGGLTASSLAAAGELHVARLFGEVLTGGGLTASSGVSYVNSWIHRHTAVPETLAAAGGFHVARLFGEVLTGGGLTASSLAGASGSGGIPCIQSLWEKPDPTHCLAHKLSGDGKTLAAARELDASRLFAEVLTGGGLTASSLAAAGELHVARLFGEVLTGGGLTASCFLAKSLPAEVSQLDVCLWRLTGSPGTLAGASYVNSWIHRHTAVPETLAAAGELHVARLFGEVLTGGGLTASCMPLANHWLAWNLSGGLRQQGNWMHRGSLPNSLPAEVSQLDVCLWRITDSPGTLAGVSYVNSWIHRHTAVPETLAAAGGFHVARLFGEVLTGGGLTASSLAGASYVNSWIHRHTAVPETLAAAGELHVARLFGEVLTGGGLTASSLAAAGELHVARLFGEVLTGGGLTASCFLAKSLPAEVSQLDVCLWRLTGSPGTLAGASYVNSWIHRHTAVPETLAAAGEFHASRVCGTKPDPTYCLAHKLSGDGKTLAAARELDASRLFAELLTGGAGVSYVNSWIHRHTAVPETLAAAGELHVARLFGEVLTGGGLTASSLAAAGELHVARLFGEVLTGGGLTASSGVSYVNSWIHRHTAVPETLAAAGGFHVARLFGEVLTGGGLTASSLAGASGSGGIPCIQSLWEKPDPTHCLAHKLSGDGKTLAAARELDASRLFAEVLTGGGLTASSLAAAGELHVARLFGEVLTGGGLTASCFLAKSLPAEVSQLDVCLWRLTGSPGTLAGASYVNSWIHRHTAVPETLAAAGEFHASRVCGTKPDPTYCLAHKLSGDGKTLAAARELDASRLFAELLTGGAGVSYVNSWIHRHTAVPETLAAAGGFHVARLFGEVLTGGGLTASSLAAAGELHVARLFGEVLTGGGLTASSLAAAGELHVARLFGEVLTGGGLTASSGVSYVNSWIHRHTAVPETLAAAGGFHVARLFGEVLTGGGLTASSLAGASGSGGIPCIQSLWEKPDPTHCLAHKLSGDGKTLAAARELDASRLFAEVLTGGGLTASSLAAAGELHVARLFGEVLTGGGLTASWGVSYVNSWIYQHTAVPETLAAAGELHVARLFGEVLTGGGLTASSGVSYVNSWIYQHTAVPETLAAAGELHVARLFGEVLTGGGLTASSGVSYVNSWIYPHTAVPETLAAVGEFHASRVCGTKPDPTHCLAHKLSGDGKTLAAARELDASRLFAELLTGGAGVSYVNSWIYQHTAVPETLAAAGEFHASRVCGTKPDPTHCLAHKLSGDGKTLAAARELDASRLFAELLTGGGFLAKSLPAEVSQLHVCLWRITGSPETLAGVSYVNSWIHRHTAVPETLAAAGELHVARLFGEVLTGGGLTASCSLPNSLPAEVSQLDVCLGRLTGSPGTLAGASYVNSWIHRHTAVPETLAAAGEFHASRVCGTKPDPTHCLAHKLSGDGKTLAAARELDASRLFAELLTGGAGASYVNSWIHRHTAVPETLAAAGELHVARLFGEVLTGGGLTASCMPLATHWLAWNLSGGLRQQGNWMHRGSLPNSLPAEVSQLDVCLWRLTGSPETLAGVSGGLRQQGNWMHRGSLPNSLPAEVSQLDVCLWRLTGSPETLAGASYVNSWIHRHTAVPETLAAAGELHVARLFGEVLTGGGLTASCMPLATHWLAWNLSGGLRQQGNWMHRGSLPNSLPAEVSQLDVCLWRLTGSPETLAGVSGGLRQQGNWMHRGSLPNSLPAEVSQLDVCLWRLTGSPETLAGVSYVNSWIHRHTAVPETLAAAGEFHASRVCGTKPDPTHCLAHKLSGDGKTLAAAMELDASRLFAELLTGGVPETLAAAGEFHASRVCGTKPDPTHCLAHKLSGDGKTLAAARELDASRLFAELLTGGAGASYVNSWIHRHTAMPETLAAAGEFHASRVCGTKPDPTHCLAHKLSGDGKTLAAAGELHVARLFGELLTGGGLTASCFLAKSLPAEVSQLDVCLWRLTGSPGTLAGASYVNSWIHRHTAVPETLAAAGEFHASRVCGTKPDPTHCLAHKLSGDGKTLAAARELDASRLFAELLTGGGLTASCMPLANHWLA